GNDLNVMTAFLEEKFGVRGLEVVGPDLRARDVGCDRQDRSTASVTVEKPVDQMQIARPAASCADGKPSGNLRFRARGKRSGFLVPHVDPFNGSLLTKRIGDAIQ